MNRATLTLIIGMAVCTGTAHSTEIFSNTAFENGLTSVSQEAVQDMSLCLQSEQTSSKALRACSKSLKTVAPISGIRSDIYTRRGLIYLSKGKFDNAARDFGSAARLDDDNEFAFLGQGYAALMNKDYARATQFFEDCKTHNKAAPLAAYGLGLVKELSGDQKSALAQYSKAMELRPGWSAPEEEYKRLQSSL